MHKTDGGPKKKRARTVAPLPLPQDNIPATHHLKKIDRTEEEKKELSPYAAKQKRANNESINKT